MQKSLSTTLLWLIVSVCFGQQKPEVLAYIQQYKDIALQEMVRTHIPASITLAQGILESGSGKSALATKANNHFGIKCKADWTGKTMYQTDDAPNECFRSYDNAKDSYIDHSNFLTDHSRYAFLFKLNITDYKAWAYGLKDAGYATHPRYAGMLLDYIETYHLSDYDQVGLALMNKQGDNNTTVATTTTTYKTFNDIVSNTVEANTTTNNKTTNTATPETPPTTANTTYSSTEFKLNGLKAIRARGNVDPFSVAFNYNIEYNDLLIYNDMVQGDNFKDGDIIYLQAKKNHGSDDTYTVKSGETMWQIAQKTGIKIQQLYDKNHMQMNDQAYSGEILYLQKNRPAAPRTMTYAAFLKQNDKVQNSERSSIKPVNQQGNVQVVYQVQQKDTLYSIARKFNTTIDQLKRSNNLDNDNLQAGQTLVIGN